MKRLILGVLFFLIGISRLVVSKLLNHSEASSVTSIYDRHSYDAEKRNALESWGEKLKAILSDKELANNVVWLKNTG